MACLVSDLSDYLIARLLLRNLWQIQDAGGVSVGRSLQSILLEAALSLMPIPDDLEADSFRFQEAELIDEATERINRFREWPIQLALFSELEWQSNEVLIFLLLSYLQQHYLHMAENVEMTQDWSFVMESPYVVIAILLLIPRDDFPTALARLPYKDLVRLANDRFYQKCRQDEYEEFGYA